MDNLPTFSKLTTSQKPESKADLANESKLVKKAATTKVIVEKETDGKWMYCQQKGCHFWTRKQIRMERHEKSHVPGDDKFYQCPECHLKICSLSKLLRHDRKFHTGFKDYECKICEAEVTDIAVHMRVSLWERLGIFMASSWRAKSFSKLESFHNSILTSSSVKLIFISVLGTPNGKTIHVSRLQAAIPSQKLISAPLISALGWKAIPMSKLRVWLYLY